MQDDNVDSISDDDEEDNFLDELDQNVSFEEDLNSYAYGNVEHIRYVNY